MVSWRLPAVVCALSSLATPSARALGTDNPCGLRAYYNIAYGREVPVAPDDARMAEAIGSKATFPRPTSNDEQTAYVKAADVILAAVQFRIASHASAESSPEATKQEDRIDGLLEGQLDLLKKKGIHYPDEKSFEPLVTTILSAARDGSFCSPGSLKTGDAFNQALIDKFKNPDTPTLAHRIYNQPIDPPRDQSTERQPAGLPTNGADAPPTTAPPLPQPGDQLWH